MKPSLALSFCALLLCAEILTAQTAPPDKDRLAERAERFVDLLSRGGFEEAAQDFDDTMKGAAPPAKLREIWQSLQGQLGTFKRRAGVRVEPVGAYQAAFVTTEFERSAVDLQVTFDSHGRIAGFFVVPVRAPATPSAPTAGKEAFREREVKVGSGKWELPGTLTLPQGKGPFPAVVLVHGSGPNDRDETIGPNKPFRDLAAGLAARGIAVLRYEKRTRHYGDEIASVPGLTVQEETVDDALAGVALLRKTDGVDPRRVFILGHSFGGTLAPRIGRRDAEIAGYVLLAAAARPLEDAMVEQLSYIASLDGTVNEEEKKQLDGLKAEVAKVKTLADAAGDSKDRVLGAPPSYWLDLRGYDAPAVAKTLNRPMLVLQAESDYMVTMTDFAAWKKALDGRQNVTFKSYPGLNHVFMEVEGKDSPASYMKPGRVAEAVIDDIAGWVKSVPAPWLRPQ
jgi:dienelactone hydrolase